MKILKIVKWFLFILIFFHSYALINLSVSNKYEVDLMKTHLEINKNVDPIIESEVAIRSNEITKSVNFHKYSLIVTALLLILVFIISSLKKKKLVKVID